MADEKEPLEQPESRQQKEEAGQPLQIKISEKGGSSDSERFFSTPVKWVKRVDDYFLVGQKNNNSSSNDTATSLFVFSAEGKRIRELRKEAIALSLLQMLRSVYPSITHLLGKKNSDKSTDSRVNIGRVPEPLRSYILESKPYLYGEDIAHVNNIESKTYDLSTIYPSQQILGGKYLVNLDKDIFFAIKVKNNSGVALPQDQWVTYTMETLHKDMPEELAKWKEQRAEARELSSFISLTSNLDAEVTDQGMIIFKAGDKETVLHTEPSISDRKGNFVVSASTPPILYYIPHDQPTQVSTIILDDVPSQWQVRKAPFPAGVSYPRITNLSIDPTGSVLIFESEGSVKIITADTLELVGQIPEAKNPSLDSTGQLAVMKRDKNPKTSEIQPVFRFYEIDYNSFAQKRLVEQQKRIAQSLKVTSLFMTPAEKAAHDTATKAESLRPILDSIIPLFQEPATRIRDAKNIAEIETLETALDVLKEKLKFEMPGQKESVDTIVNTILKTIIEPLKKELYKDAVAQMLAKIHADLQDSLNLAGINFLNQDYRQIESMVPFLERSQQEEVAQLGKVLQKKTIEYITAHSEEFISQAESLVTTAKHKLEGFTSIAEMDDWMEYEMPTILRSLAILQQQCPLEATTAISAIMKARNDLSMFADTYEKRFKQEYVAVREKAAEATGEMGRIISNDSQRLINRIKEKGFTNRTEAERYVATSETYQQILEDINVLKHKDPDRAKSLRQDLEVHLSNLYYAIDRNSGTEVTKTGQQFVFFGDTRFPIWEGKVKQKGERKVDVVFSVDRSTQGPGVTADKVLGDIAVKVTDGEGKQTVVRLFQDLDNEGDFRFGLSEKMGESIPPSYTTGADYQIFKKCLADWQKGDERSLIKKEYTARLKKLRELYKTRPKRNQHPQGEEGKLSWLNARQRWDEENRQQYEQYFTEFALYCREKNISLLRRVTDIKNKPDTEHLNGKGYIPEWSSHWVVDPQTEFNLENMAQVLEMQSELQEGMLLLKGHAGTGKDVLVKMFCEKTRRLYFAVDCTKWTTEFELSEDIVLESVNGASQTLKVPSNVLKAITTPGAVLYFNELNAMPEQAQIFLHSLLDEKRSLTLKTSSGDTIKAHPSVLIIGSMNQGYPGTFEPQFATKSRTVSLIIEYPPLLREIDKDDPNQKTKPYNVSEALRIARGVSSLQEMTYEADLTRNGFVKLWDQYVNGIDTGSADPTAEQKFDLDVILALVQFGNELREHFIATFENQKKTSTGNKTLEVGQPITAREMRRAAYVLGRMSPAQKAASNPEDVAKDLLERFFFSHLYKVEPKQKLLLHMKTNMNSRRRLAA